MFFTFLFEHRICHLQNIKNCKKKNYENILLKHLKLGMMFIIFIDLQFCLFFLQSTTHEHLLSSI